MKINRNTWLFAILSVLIAGGVVGFALLNRASSSHESILVDNKPTGEWQLVQTNAFALSLPPNWEFNRLQGIDSYVGEFVGDNMTLRFDYGHYSDLKVLHENLSDYRVTYEIIDGYRAKVVTSTVDGRGTTGVFFGQVPGDNVIGGGNPNLRFKLSGENLTVAQQETALRIFRTLQFVNE